MSNAILPTTWIARAFHGSQIGLEQRDVLPTLDPPRFVWYHAGGSLELDLMLVDERPPQFAHVGLFVDGDPETPRAKLQGVGVCTNDVAPPGRRPRSFCRVPCGNAIELCRLEP